MLTRQMDLWTLRALADWELHFEINAKEAQLVFSL